MRSVFLVDYVTRSSVDGVTNHSNPGQGRGQGRSPRNPSLVHFYHLIVIGVISFLLGGSTVFIIVTQCHATPTFESKDCQSHQSVSLKYSLPSQGGVASNGYLRRLTEPTSQSQHPVKSDVPPTMTMPRTQRAMLIDVKQYFHCPT